MDEETQKVELILKLKDTCYKISKHVDTLFSNIEAFLAENTQKLSIANIEDVQKIYQSCLNFKKSIAEIMALDPQKMPGTQVSEFLLTVRHNFRNPVNILQGYTEILLEDFREKQQTSFVNQFLDMIFIIHQILKLIDEIRMPILTRADYVRFSTVVAPQPIGSEEYRKFIEATSILVVDDMEENCQILERFLKFIGYKNITTVQSGLAALEILAKSEIDIVLLDMEMPGMTGIDVLKAIKKEVYQPSVIVISGYDSIEKTIECIKLGAEDFILKPFNQDLLRVRIRASMEKKWSDKLLQLEKLRYEGLIRSIFPPIIVKELIETGQVQARSYKNVAILFLDIVNFTPYCEVHAPAEIIKNLQELVDMCETIAIKHNILKIKTIGDSFLGVAGMLMQNENPVLSCIDCAVEMLDKSLQLKPGWHLRAGINFGTVIGGVVGHRQYLFDIWGDAVNTGARIQALAKPNSVFVTKSAWLKVQDICVGKSLGELKVKGKSPIEIIEYTGRK